jgi:hypothetical protein
MRRPARGSATFPSIARIWASAENSDTVVPCRVVEGALRRVGDWQVDSACSPLRGASHSGVAGQRLQPARL